MAVLKMILTIVFIVLSVVLTVIILVQQGKNAGLGALAGGSETYWSKNKGRSAEGMLDKVTKILIAAFIILAAVLNLGIF